MKKITLLALSLALSTFTFAQTSFGDTIQSDPTILTTTIPTRDACSQEVLTNSLENGGLFGGTGNQSLAIDIDVPANTTFSITEVIPTYVGDATTSTFVFLADEGGFPGIELASIESSESANIITGNNFGFDFHQITYALDTPYLIEGGATGVKVWMQIICDADGWESSTVSNTGDLGAFKNDASGQAWAIGTSDYVYQLNGDCNLLGANDNLLSQVAVYPNPTTDILNVKVPSTITINGATLVNVLGANTGLRLVNGSINTSSLASGVYILTVNTSAGTLTQKVVKQ